VICSVNILGFTSSWRIQSIPWFIYRYLISFYRDIWKNAFSKLFVVGSKEKYTFTRQRLNIEMAYSITITQWTLDLLLSSKANIFKDFFFKEQDVFIPLLITSSNVGPQNDLCLDYKTTGHQHIGKVLPVRHFKNKAVWRNNKQAVTVTSSIAKALLSRFVITWQF